MAQEIITQSEFAKRMGIKSSSASNLAKKKLLAAREGNRLDWYHPVVVNYRLEKIKADQLQDDVAQFYGDAVELARKTGRLTKTFLHENTGVTRSKAGALYDAVVALEGNIGKNLMGQAAKSHEAKNAEPPPQTAPAGSDAQVPENIQAYADMPLRKIISLYGTDIRFLDWLKATKEIEAIEANRIKNAEKVGELVARALVQKGMLDVLDGAFTRMMTDGAKSIAAEAHSMALAEMSVEEIEQMAAKKLSTFIKPTKAKMVRSLRNA